MANSLANWNAHFEEQWAKLNLARRNRAGALLPLVPTRQEWDDFQADVRREWRSWQDQLCRHPYCLLALYCGVAFYEYDEARFWPQFTRAVGATALLANQQQINQDFAYVARELGLPIRQRDAGTDYVGSAVWFIGVPLSLWEGFLSVCRWAWHNEEWKDLSDAEWAEAMARRAGSRTRLKNFLTDNREAATVFIRELHDARRILSKDHKLTIAEVRELCWLRAEYFDEAPETAEFLRPHNPDSLFSDRAYLLWDARRRSIRLDLPAVALERLPCVWRVGELEKDAASTPVSLDLNAVAFQSTLVARLVNGKVWETKRLRGLADGWGLFDEERRRFVNLERPFLPERRYTLLSRGKLEDLKRDGFDEDECAANALEELSDGTSCYLTELFPVKTRPHLSFRLQNKPFKLNFAPEERITAHFFAGAGWQAARGCVREGKLAAEGLPQIYVTVPAGYFKDALATLRGKLELTIDDGATCRVFGRWESCNVPEQGSDSEIYLWRWADKPLGQAREETTFHSLQELNRQDFVTPILRDTHCLSVQSDAFGFKHEQEIFFLPREFLVEQHLAALERRWSKLPGAMWPFFLLGQMPAGATWEQIARWRSVFAPDERLSLPALKLYEKRGFLAQRGSRWRLAESRAALASQDGGCVARYCGSPFVLWGLYKQMLRDPAIDRALAERGPQRVFRVGQAVAPNLLPTVELAPYERGRPQHFVMRWRSEFADKIRRYFERQQVVVAKDLWRS
jgi:hypothetical protein